MILSPLSFLLRHFTIIVDLHRLVLLIWRNSKVRHFLIWYSVSNPAIELRIKRPKVAACNYSDLQTNNWTLTKKYIILLTFCLSEKIHFIFIFTFIKCKLFISVYNLPARLWNEKLILQSLSNFLYHWPDRGNAKKLNQRKALLSWTYVEVSTAIK